MKISEKEEAIRNIVQEVAEATLPELSELDNDSLAYEIVDGKLDSSAAVTLCDPFMLDYLCHALAENAKGKIALVPFGGDFLVSEELDHGLKVFAAELSKRLDGFAENFAGLVSTDEELCKLAEGLPVNQVRFASGDPKTGAVDPLFALQQNDPAWRALKELSLDHVDVVFWYHEGEQANLYDTANVDYMGTSLSADGLSEIIELPAESQAQIFVFEGNAANKVRLSRYLAPGEEESVYAFREDLLANHNYTPSYYLGSEDLPKTVALGGLCSKIQRGTGLSESKLNIVRGFHEFAPGCLPASAATGGGFWSPSDFYYIDNSSIGQYDKVSPKVITEIPAGQERYTVYPEDGGVVLVTRNGKGLAYYEARRPTLISNNLFIVRPDLEKIDPEYMGYAMHSNVASGQICRYKKPMSKSDIEQIRIPVGTAEAMQNVVDVNRANEKKILELEDEIFWIRYKDTLASLASPQPPAINEEPNGGEPDER